MKGNDFLDYEGLTKYHDRLVESVDEKIASAKKQLERKDQELLDYEIRPISGAVGVIQDEMDEMQNIYKAISGILNVFHDNLTWQDE